LRDGRLTLNPQLTTALLGMVDAVRQILGSIEVSGEGRRHAGGDPARGREAIKKATRGVWARFWWNTAQRGRPLFRRDR
jgi:hypothetical protein